MKHGIHFISGLPRSGSTLLAALLRQNPRFHAGMTSPVGGLFNAMLIATSQRNETSVFLQEEHRRRLLLGCFDAYYAEEQETKVIFDTNRQWATKLPVLTTLFPKARMICCVRNPAWIIDSIESLVRRNVFDLSGIFNYDAGGTVYSRAEGLSKNDGMVGFAWQALREAVYGAHAERLLLVRYESLTRNPLGTLGAIYTFLNEELFSHDPQHIDPCYDMVDFDMRLGTPGLHEVGPSVRATARPTLLPPDLFARYERDAFWEDAAQLPRSVRMI